MASRSCFCAFLVLFLVAFEPTCKVKATDIPPPLCRRVVGSSAELIEFAVNLEYLIAEFFLCISRGEGINIIAPDLVHGGPISIGCATANLDSATRAIFEEFGIQTVRILRTIFQTSSLIREIPMPQINISVETLRSLVYAALGVNNLTPPYNIYANKINLLTASTTFVSLAQQYLRGISPYIVGDEFQQLTSSVLSTVSGNFGVLRGELFRNENVTVVPYNFNLGTLVERGAQLVNRLAMCGDKDEGLTLQFEFGNATNIIPFTPNFTAQTRTAREVLRALYGTGDATRPGGLLPRGATGRIAEKIVTLKLN
ncbi:hypothetical protein CCACVL1_22270 [Corchorus capsularis]|uniref:Desiccation-related protein PCC13-62-like protein n=1 Tax=Corchorus capsularis TaxID=210143 RepID=A0A1R3H0B8_COCAP|nr:hypothetical protein CCACVL1_22270 [Corchorus capsularis]